MMIVKDISVEEVTKFFLEDPNLILLGLPDHTIVNLYETKEYIPDYGSFLLGVYDNEELLAVLKYEYFSNSAINIHPYLKSKLHGTGAFTEVQKALKDYFLNNGRIVKAIVMTPVTCSHVPPTCIKFGFKKEGHLTNCVYWRNELVDVEIYALDLRDL